jgi:hypothetical protein
MVEEWLVRSHFRKAEEAILIARKGGEDGHHFDEFLAVQEPYARTDQKSRPTRRVLHGYPEPFLAYLGRERHAQKVSQRFPSDSRA